MFAGLLFGWLRSASTSMGRRARGAIGDGHRHSIGDGIGDGIGGIGDGLGDVFGGFDF